MRTTITYLLALSLGTLILGCSGDLEGSFDDQPGDSGLYWGTDDDDADDDDNDVGDDDQSDDDTESDDDIADDDDNDVSDDDTGDDDDEINEGEGSQEQEDLIHDLISSAEAQEWPDAGGPQDHYLPYQDGVHMGISQGTNCGGHVGDLSGSVDFTVTGNYESAHGLYTTATQAGTVWAVETGVTGFVDNSYGNYVFIRHTGDGTYSMHAHLAYGSILVSYGQEVCLGDLLGLIGNTGESFGEHLHYEHRDGNENILTPSFYELPVVPSSCNPCNTNDHTVDCYASQNEINCGDTCNCTDSDLDGYLPDNCTDTGCNQPRTDCNDNDPSIHPGVAEFCDDIDSNCSGMGDEPYNTYYQDSDGDGYGSNSSQQLCAPSSPYNAVQSGDCNDSDPQSHPGAWDDPCDNTDQDCSGSAANPTSHSDSDCYNGDVYWFDSCGDVEGLHTDCNGLGCNGGICGIEFCGNGTCSGGESSCSCPQDCGTCSGCCSGNVCMNGTSDSYCGSGGDTCDSCNGNESCDYQSCSCDSHDYTACHNNNVYWFDACGNAESIDENCTHGCASGECLAYAEDQTNLPLDCETNGAIHQNILTATQISVSDPTGDPQITVTWEKCDGSDFGSTKNCHVHVGAPGGVERMDFTWYAGTDSYTTTFEGWPVGSPFVDAPCGEDKEFYVTCDDGYHYAYWISDDPVRIERVCD